MKSQICISIQISLKYVHKSPIDNKWALIQVMDWHQTGNKSLSEPKLIQFTDTYMQHLRRWVDMLYLQQLKIMNTFWNKVSVMPGLPLKAKIVDCIVQFRNFSKRKAFWVINDSYSC